MRIQRILIVLAAVTLTHWQIYSIPFLYDEKVAVLGHPAILDLNYFFEKIISWKGFFQKPLSILTLGLNYYFSGEHVAPYHFFNLAVHLANTFLVFKLSRRFTGNGMIASLLFGLHPLATACVSRIYGRDYSIGTTFLLIALNVFLTEWNRARTNQSGFSTGARATIGLLFVLMLLSKQSFVFFPMLLFWLIMSLSEKQSREAIKFLSNSFFSALLLLQGALLFIFVYGVPYSSTAIYSPLEFLFSQLGNWFPISMLFVFPLHLSIVYDLVPHRSFFDVHVMVGAALVAILGVCAWKNRREPFWMWCGAFLIALVPTNSFFPKNEFFYDWRVYPALPFLALAIEALVCSIPKKLALPARVATALYLVFFAVVILKQNQIYQTERSTWLQATQRFPNSPITHANLAGQLFREGELLGALEHFKRAEVLAPGHHKILEGLVKTYESLGNEVQAREYRLRLGPKGP